jgi:LPS O-antigen subunit length determinant protein (WzzB/FepE family)
LDNQSATTNEYDDEIDLRELFGALWSGKIKIIVITAIFAVSSVFYALSVPNQYKAIALLAPAQSDSGGLSSALGQLGGLASLAGVNVPGGSNGTSSIAQEIMMSQSFIESFIYENQIEADIYAVTGWSEAADVLEYDPELYDVTNKEWLVTHGAASQNGPSGWQLYKAFRGMIEVSEDKKTRMVSLTLESYSPNFSKHALDNFIKYINDHMQKRKILSVERNIKYLQNQIEKTSISEMREVFYTIIEEQIKSKMLAEASPEYAFLMVSPAMVPEEKSQPDRAIICVIGTLIGGILSVLMVFVQRYGQGFYKN